MLPTILQLGPITISSLGVMLALGLFFGSFLVWQRGRTEHYEEEALMDGILLVSLTGLIASRIGYGLVNWRRLDSFWQVFQLVSRPGFLWPAGLLGGLLAAWLYCRRHKWDFWQTVDFSVFGLTVGVIFGRVGRFFSSAQLTNLGPFTFLAEALLLSLVYRALLIFSRNYRTYEWYKNQRGEANPGFLFLFFLAASCLIHLAGELLRPPTLSLNPTVGLYLLMIIGAAAWFFQRSGRRLTVFERLFKNRGGGKRAKKKRSPAYKAGMEAK